MSNVLPTNPTNYHAGWLDVAARPTNMANLMTGLCNRSIVISKWTRSSAFKSDHPTHRTRLAMLPLLAVSKSEPISDSASSNDVDINEDAETKEISSPLRLSPVTD